MSKNIIICCDGTEQNFGQSTNVVKLCQMLDLSDKAKQVVFYDPGIGTATSQLSFNTYGSWLQKKWDAAFGKSLAKNAIEAYAFIMNHYERGDKIYLFGFSRGAYTARVIAGLINKCGILRPRNENLFPFLIDLLLELDKDAVDDSDTKQARERKDDHHKKAKSVQEKKYWESQIKLLQEIASRKLSKHQKMIRAFRTTFSQHDDSYTCKIHFMGLWDTVKSTGRIFKPIRILNAVQNPDVDCIRHALALDERRKHFRPCYWNQVKDSDKDIKQVWFAGDHSDVGGGLEEKGLSQITLEWMVVEAAKKGLVFDKNKVDNMFKGGKNRPNEEGVVNNSLSFFYRLATFIPKPLHIETDNPELPWYVSYRFRSRKPIAAELFQLTGKKNGNLLMHESAKLKWAKTDYKPAFCKSNRQLKLEDFHTEPWVKWNDFNLNQSGSSKPSEQKGYLNSNLLVNDSSLSARN